MYESFYGVLNYNYILATSPWLWNINYQGIQYNGGRIFLHEHPMQASSWEEECIKRVLNLPGVDYVDMDQCQLGQKDDKGNPVKKPTRWMSKSKFILDALRKRCQGRFGW